MSDDGLPIQCCHVLTPEVNKLLLLIRIDLYTEHFSSLATHHRLDGTAHGRGKLHIGILFVDEQRIPGLDMITLLDDDFGNDTGEIIRYKCKLAIRLQLYLLLLSLAFQVNVQAFV